MICCTNCQQLIVNMLLNPYMGNYDITIVFVNGQCQRIKKHHRKLQTKQHHLRMEKKLMKRRPLKEALKKLELIEDNTIKILKKERRNIRIQKRDRSRWYIGSWKPAKRRHIKHTDEEVIENRLTFSKTSTND